MKAAYIQKFGGPEVLTYGDLPDPAAGPGQVVVDTHAASINAADWKLAAGDYITQGQRLGTVLAKGTHIRVRARFPKETVGLVRDGQTAQLNVVDMINDVRRQGLEVSVADAAAVRNARRRVGKGAVKGAHPLQVYRAALCPPPASMVGKALRQLCWSA